jgi:hypothetical protein
MKPPAKRTEVSQKAVRGKPRPQLRVLKPEQLERIVGGGGPRPPFFIVHDG